jgi:hypothetical protein
VYQPHNLFFQSNISGSNYTIACIVLTTSQPVPDEHLIQLQTQTGFGPPSTSTQVSTGEDDPTDILLFAHDHRIGLRPGEAGHSGSIAGEDEFCGEMTVKGYT